MANKDFLIPLTSPLPSEIPCGIRFKGTYYTIATAIFIPNKLNNYREILHALDATDLLIMLIPQESRLRSVFSKELDQSHQGKDNTPNTLNSVCKINIKTGQVSETVMKNFDLDKDINALASQFQKLFTIHFWPQVSQLFAPFDQGLKRLIAHEETIESLRSSNICSYVDLFECQIALSCMWEGKHYSLVDFHAKDPKVHFIQCLLTTSDPTKGPDIVLAGVSFSSETGIVIGIKPNQQNLLTAEILTAIQENCPFPFPDYLLARGKLMRKVLAQNGSGIAFESEQHISMPS